MWRIMVWVAVLGVSGSWPSAAQESSSVPAPADAEDPAPGPDAPGSPAPPGVETPPAPGPTDLDPEAETEVALGLGTGVAAGIGLSHPLGAALRVQVLRGLSADVRDDDGRVRAVCALPIPHCAQGFLLEAEAGSGGGKLSLGLGARARVDEDDFHGAVGVGLRASLARTWGSPFGTEPGLTYLGPELDLSILRLDLSLGVLWRVSGTAGASALFSWRIGIGH
jgi:hypothetical protein